MRAALQCTLPTGAASCGTRTTRAKETTQLRAENEEEALRWAGFFQTLTGEAMAGRLPKKTAVPEPARELPLAEQARALRRPHAAGCPGRCAIAPAGWMANLWRGARGRGGTARHSTWSTSRGGSGKEVLIDNARSSGTLP